MTKEKDKKDVEQWKRPFVSNDTLENFIDTANDELKETFFIPSAKEVKNHYEWDLMLMTRKQAKKLVKKNKLTLNNESKELWENKIFIYNEKYKTLLPFQKGDIRMYDGWYMMYDGRAFHYFDDYWHELWYDIPSDEVSDTWEESDE